MLCGHFYLMLTSSVPTSSKAKEPKVGHPKKDDIFLRIMYEYLGMLQCCMHDSRENRFHDNFVFKPPDLKKMKEF